MFNEENKRRFIAERDDEVILPSNYLVRLFEKVSAMEHELNKDVSNFSLYEIKEYYKMLNIATVESLYVMNSQFSLYTQWCLQQNLVKDNQNHFLEMTKENFYDCVNKALFDSKVITKEEILSWVDDLINAKDKFIFLALFEGIRGDNYCEIVKLRPEDIDGNTLTLCTGRKVDVSSKLISIANDCIEETKYYGSEISDDGIQRVFPLVNRGYVIKDYPNIKDDVSEFQQGRRIYGSIRRSLDFIGKMNLLKANDIYESGKLDMIKRRAAELGMNNVEYIKSAYINEVEERYDCRIVPTQFIYKYKDYLV